MKDLLCHLILEGVVAVKAAGEKKTEKQLSAALHVGPLCAFCTARNQFYVLTVFDTDLSLVALHGSTCA